MFATDINKTQLEQGLGQMIEARAPMGRLGELSELDGPLLLLASDAGSYMTGSIVTVDGGHLCADMI